jgi:hypothetical protein
MSFRSNSARRCWAALALSVCASAALALPPDRTRFGVVIERGDLVTAEKWLDEGLDPDFEADRIGTGLMIGAWEGRIDIMDLFLRRGADIERVSRIDEQALQLAAWKGHLQAVKWLLARGAKVDRGGKHWSALHYAAFNGHDEIVRLLLAHGANVDARTTNDSTALMLAAREGHERIARALLDAGADPRPVNDWGETAFTWAMRYRNLRIAKLVAAAADAMPPEATPPSFAAAVSAPPESFGAPTRSLPAPPDVAAILDQIRAAEAQNQPTEALRESLHQAIARLKEGSSMMLVQERARPAAPKALVVTAKRGGAGAERAELVYENRGASAPGEREVGEALQAVLASQARGEPAPELRRALFDAVARFKGERPAVVEAKLESGSVGEIMERIREARAQGRPTEDLRRALREAVERFKRGEPGAPP